MDIQKVAARLREFTAERDWEQFHSPKNLSMAVAAEAGELVERFQWLTEEQSAAVADSPKELGKVADEIADVMIFLTRLCDQLGVDLERAVWNKIEKNESKYPVELAKGNATKYTEFEAE